MRLSLRLVFEYTAIQVEYDQDLRWYWWEMYAGVEEAGGGADDPGGGIP